MGNVIYTKEQQTVLDRGFGLLNLIAAGEIAGAEAAEAARNIMDEVDAVKREPTSVIYQGEIAEWDTARAQIQHPVTIRLENNGAVWVSFGRDDDESPQIGLLIEVNVGKPCVHVFPTTGDGDSTITLFGEAPDEYWRTSVRIDGSMRSASPNWFGTGWTVSELRGNRYCRD